MGLAELVLLAVGLSMDAFAVSICKGLGMKKINLKVAVVLGLFFGGFQAGMPVIGWALGSQFMSIIGPIDHWIAFILLAFIGGKMLWEAFTEDEDEGDGKDAEKIELGEYLILAIATSIDALAVGISFAALSVIGLKILLEHLGFFGAVKHPSKLNVRMRPHAEFCMSLFMQTFACHTRMQKSAR